MNCCNSNSNNSNIKNCSGKVSSIALATAASTAMVAIATAASSAMVAIATAAMMTKRHQNSK